MIQFAPNDLQLFGIIVLILHLINWRSERGMYASYKKLPLSVLDLQGLMEKDNATVEDLLLSTTTNGITIRRLALNSLIVYKILPILVFVSLTFYFIAFVSYVLGWVNINLVTFHYNSSFWSKDVFLFFGFLLVLFFLMILIITGIYKELHEQHPNFQHEQPWRIIAGLAYAKNEPNT